MMSAGKSVDYKNRRKNRDGAFEMSDIQTEFQAAAYTYYLAGRLTLTEFKACLYFGSVATLNLLFAMIETQPDKVTLNNLKNMTKQNLTSKMVNNIAEFCHEYKAHKEHKGRSH